MSSDSDRGSSLGIERAELLPPPGRTGVAYAAKKLTPRRGAATALPAETPDETGSAWAPRATRSSKSALETGHRVTSCSERALDEQEDAMHTEVEKRQTIAGSHRYADGNLVQ